MELRDLIVTPILIIVVYLVSYVVRPYVTDSLSRKYFFPALTVKIIGAILLGILYQFYYSTGDTFAFHTTGSRIVWEAFADSPVTGIKLLFADGKYENDTFRYAANIANFRNPSTYNVVRLATIFDLFTFSTYSATAVLFAVFSFIGMWQFFLTFYKQFPHLHFQLALAAFFIPSVFFWGSGILKDTIVIGCLGMATYQFYKIFFENRYGFSTILLLLFSLIVIFGIKKFVLQAYLPAVIVWIGMKNLTRIRSVTLRILVFPILILVLLFASYFSVLKIGENDKRYAVSKIAETAQITANDIRYWTGKDAGSGYSLGALDGSFASMMRLGPAAINVALFRPYLWEVSNPLMLASSLESLFFLVVVVFILFSGNASIKSLFRNSNITFTLLFSIVFAFAVGVSTFNFGTLARYKIPLLPFLAVALVLIWDDGRQKKLRKQLESMRPNTFAADFEQKNS
jgi:hypothetical protein